MDPRTQAQLDRLSPYHRARAEALMARYRTAEARAEEEAARSESGPRRGESDAS